MTRTDCSAGATPSGVSRIQALRASSGSLREHGAAPDQAPGLATLIVAAVEGAIAMCRAKRSMKPLDQVAQQLEALIAGALDRPA